MTTFRLTITLRQPLLITDTVGEPNSSISRPYIPGATIRGMLAGRYLQQHPTQDAASDAVFRRLILDGTTRFLHAYPASMDGQHRLLPTPRSLQKGKHDQREGYVVYDTIHSDFCSEDRNEVERDPQQGELKPLGALFAHVSANNKVETCEPLTTIAVHTARDRQKGRSITGSGQVFRYEALAAEQSFISYIVCADTDAELIRTLLPRHAALGRSRGAGYGGVQIDVQEEHANWREVEGEIDDIEGVQKIRLQILSDTILTTGEGCPLLAIDSQNLSRILGFQVAIMPEKSSSSVTAVGSFNRTWKLPMPQIPALAAGSVFTLNLIEPLCADKIRTLELTGIGERCTEGYGRVAFVAEPEEYQLCRFLPKVPLQLAPTQLSEISGQLIARMRQRQLTAQIDIHMYNSAYHFGLSKDANISKAQLARIRSLVRQNLADGNTQYVLTQFEDIKTAAKDQFNGSRMEGGKTLQSWIIELLKNPTSVWDSGHLNMKNSEHVKQNMRLLNQEAPLTDLLARQTALRLIDTVLSVATKQNRGKE